MVSDNLVLDNFWTNSGFTCPISVHAASHWTGAVQTLYLNGQSVDRACTFELIRHTFDRDWISHPISVQPTNGY